MMCHQPIASCLQVLCCQAVETAQSTDLSSILPHHNTKYLFPTMYRLVLDLFG